MRVAIVSCFETYQNRIDDMERYYLSKNFDVTIVKSNFLHFEKKKIDKKIKKKNEIYINVPKYRKNISISRIFSHYKFAKKCVNYLETKEFDLLHILIPPNYLCKVVSKLTYRPKIIYDVIDFWPETMPINRISNSLVYKWWQSLRDTFIRKSDYIITECKLFEEKLIRNKDLKNVSTIYFAREKIVNHLDLLNQNNKIEFVYLGSINNIIDIDFIIRILKEINIQKAVLFHIIGDGEKKKELITKLINHKISYDDHGKIYSKDKKRQIFEKCSFGFNIMKKNVFVGLTMKSLDYFQFGLPIINNIQFDTARLVDNYNIGINMLDSNAFKKDISLIIRESEKKRNLTLRKNTIEMFDENFSYKILKCEMDKIMEELNK